MNYYHHRQTKEQGYNFFSTADQYIDKDLYFCDQGNTFLILHSHKETAYFI